MNRAIVLSLLSLLHFVSHGATVDNISFVSTSVNQYDKVEATFTLGNSNFSNPYDYDDISVVANITLPDNSVFSYPCFYYVPGTINGGDVSLNESNATWMFRFSPQETGEYSISFSASENATSNTSSPTTISVSSNTSQGFVQLDPNNNQFYRYDNDDPYYPSGINIGWSNNQYSTFYDEYTDLMKNNGLNFFRVWMTHYARQSLLWSDTGGNWWDSWYDDPLESGNNSDLRRYSAKGGVLIEEIVNLAEEKGLMVQLCLQHHGQFSGTVNSDWGTNPFNISMGGYLNSAGEYFTNTQALADTKNLYTYIVARWGYSANIFAWELFNEVEFTDGTDPDIDSWHLEMSNHIASIDIHNHIITTSSGGDDSTMPLFDDNPNIDLLQYHTYNPDVARAAPALGEELRSSLNKPVLGGEFGSDISNGAYDPHPDSWGDHLRQTNWTGFMTEVPQVFWYWDYYIYNSDLWSQFTPFNNILSDFDVVTETGGNHASLSFNNNPSSMTDLTLSPGSSGWENTTTDYFIIDENGETSGLGGLNVFLKSQTSHADDYITTFDVNIEQGGTVTMDNESGNTTLQVTIDGMPAQGSPFSINGGNNISFPISAGNHIVEFFNSGSDWVQVNSYTFPNVSVSNIKGYIYSGDTSALAYVYDKTMGSWADPDGLTEFTTVDIDITNLEDNVYDVYYYDPITGKEIEGEPIVRTATSHASATGSLPLTLPGFKKELVIKIKPSNPAALPITINSFQGNDIGDYDLLAFQVFNENEDDYYILSGSRNGINFSELTTIEAQGYNSYTFKSYKKYGYYRLTSKKGEQFYIQVDRNLDGLQVYTDDSYKQFSIKDNHPRTGNFLITLVNTNGQVIYNKRSTDLNLDIDVSHSSSGLYILNIIEGSQSIYSKKLIKF